MRRKNVSEIDTLAGYIFGKLEGQISTIAASRGLPTSELTSRVGNLFLTEGRGFGNPMPSVRQKAPGKRSSVEPVEMGHGTQGNKTQKRKHSTETRKAISDARKSYWSKMTVAERKAEVARRMAKRKH